MLSKDDAVRELWFRGEISAWKLHPAQQEIYNKLRSLPKDQREALVFCSRRWGKSYCGVVMALEDAIKNPGVQVAIVGPTIKQTKAIVTPLIRKITADAPEGLITQSKSTSTWNIANGSSLILGGFDTILESMRGLDIFSLYLEETGQATADLGEYTYLLYSVLFPTMMHHRGRITHLTTPARLVDHPLHLETLPKCRSSGAFYKLTIKQNPLLTPLDVEKEIELAGGRGDVNCERELFCEIIREKNLVIVPQFDEAIHVAEIEPSHPLKYFVGGDLGYTKDLSAFLLAGYDHNLGRILILAEKTFQPETPSSEIVESLQEWAKFDATYVVDIQGNTRTDMSTLGLSTVTPIKDKFDSTITFIRNEFFNDQVLIHPDCKILIETLRSGMFNKTRTDFLRTSNGHADHIMALVYLARSIDRQTDLRPKPSRQNVFSLPKPENSDIQGLTYDEW